MSKRLPCTLLAVSFTIWVVGCAEAPTALVEDAKERVESLAAEAPVYAPDEYKAALDAVAQLDAALEAQAERFGLLRSYDRVTELAMVADRAAGEVEQAIDAEKQRLRAEAGQMVTDAELALTGARQQLLELPADEASALQRELAVAEASLSEVNTALDGREAMEAYQEAKSALESARRTSASIAKVGTERREAQEALAARVRRGEVDIPRAVLADGQPLAAGVYQVRLTEEGAPPVGGETAGSTRWIEFLREGTVVGRDLATVISDAEIDKVAKSPPPRNEARVDELKGGEYVRFWLNRSGLNYLVHMPVVSG